MIGISFHVGSGCMDPPIYGKAIKAAKKLFDYAQLVGFDFKLLDIGGGFPGDKFTTIEQVCCTAICKEEFGVYVYFIILILSFPLADCCSCKFSYRCLLCITRLCDYR